VFTFFHLFEEGAYLRVVLNERTPVSYACTDLLLPIAECVLHRWGIYMNIVFYGSHSLKSYLYIVYLFLALQEWLICVYGNSVDCDQTSACKQHVIT
jgi:hypothetical protein